MESGLRFIDRKQEEHKREWGVYADTCYKLGEWCEEYAKQSVRRGATVCQNGGCDSTEIVEFLGRNKRQCQLCGEFWKTGN